MGLFCVFQPLNRPALVVLRYSYFDVGNIRSKREYDYTTAAEPSDWDVKISYEYDTAWKYKLIKYGETITYDEICNPLSYLGRT